MVCQKDVVNFEDWLHFINFFSNVERWYIFFDKTFPIYI